MKISRLQYITNGQTLRSIINEVTEVLDAGVDWVQLRVKDPRLNIYDIAEQVKFLCKDRATFILNDHTRIARDVGADGVHLGLEDMPIEAAREMLGEGKIIGGTCNTLEEVIQRQKSGADYIGLGPYQFTATKKKLSPVLGLAGYKEIVPKKENKLVTPIIAIGGIQLEDIKELLDNTGIHGVAVSSLIRQSENKAMTVKSIMKNWKE